MTGSASRRNSRGKRIVRAILTDFIPRFAIGGEVLLQIATNRRAEVLVRRQGTKPPLMIYASSRRAQGGATARRQRLATEVGQEGASAVFVVAVLDRSELGPVLLRASVGTTIWIANEPEHLIQVDAGPLRGPLRMA